MLDKLPIELVGAVLASAAEDLIYHDRATLLSIALSSSIGYTSSLPSIYRTLVIHGHNLSAVDSLFEEAYSSIGGGRLSEAPSHRILPLIRRVFIGPDAESAAKYLRHLPKLETLYTCTVGRMTDLAKEPLSRTFAQIFVLAAEALWTIAPTVTHVSYFYHFQMPAFQTYTKESLRDHVTHVAIELNNSVGVEAENHFVDALEFLLRRTPRTTVALRLYRIATEPETRALVFRVLRAVAADDLHRVLLWFDIRPVENNDADIELSRQDALIGRTPWSEGRAVALEEMDGAEAELGSSLAGLSLV